MNKEILIIGGGIHGCIIAVDFATNGFKVTLIVAKKIILEGSSAATHNRVHLGYHYPRSKETAEECISGYNNFIENFKDFIIFPDFYYLIAKEGSNVSAEQYKTFMLDLGLSCDSFWPASKYLNYTTIEDSFKVSEGCYDVYKMKSYFLEIFLKLDVNLISNFCIHKGISSSPRDLILTDSKSNVLNISTDLIINCTYTFTNNLQKLFH